MSRLSNAAWKKRLVRLAVVLLLLASVLLIIAFTRFNFSQEAYPRLSWLQQALGVNQPAYLQANVRPQIIGHRGSGLKPTDGGGFIGNTMEAIRIGIDANADWIEIDVRQSRDGVLMVFHDENVGRNTNGEGKFDQFRRDELQALKVMVDPVERIATLEDVFLQFSSRGVQFILDIKIRNIRDDLLPLVKKYFSEDQIILFGVYEVLQEYVGSGYALGYTALWSEGWSKYRSTFGHSFIIQRCDRLECDYLILPAIFLNQSLIDDAKSRGLAVWTYGSDDERDWSHSTRRGITGLIVDQTKNAWQTFRSP